LPSRRSLQARVPERIEIGEAIWDTVAADAETFPLTEPQKAELDRRLADLEADPDAEARGRYAPVSSGIGDASPRRSPPR